MIKLNHDYSVHVDTDNPNHPGGAAINTSSEWEEDGTPILADLVNDSRGWKEALIIEAHGKFSVSGNVEKHNESDVLNALKTVTERITNGAVGAHNGDAEAHPQIITKIGNETKERQDADLQLEESINAKAPIESPSFSGTPSAPHQNSNQPSPPAGDIKPEETSVILPLRNLLRSFRRTAAESGTQGTQSAGESWADFNSLITPGSYFHNDNTAALMATLNRPPNELRFNFSGGNVSAVLHVTASHSNRLIQELYVIHTEPASIRTFFFFRHRSSSTEWRPWERIATGSDFTDSSEYTFIIDSDAALAAWANDTPGNDYSRILIKAGTWELSSPLTGGTLSNPVAVIDISNGRTLSVVGEAGSKIVINITTSQGITIIAGIKGMATGTHPSLVNPGKDFFFHNISIQMNRDIGSGTIVAFHNCTNLTNCTSNSTGRDSRITGFSNCTSLINCIGNSVSTGGTGNNAGFFECSNLTNCTGISDNSTGAVNNSGFRDCRNLTNCTGTGTGAGTGTGNNSGFRDCRNLTNCTGTGTGTGAGAASNSGFRNCRTGFGCRNGPTASSSGAFQHCLMAQSAAIPTTNDWANTAAGGWNDPSNPG